MLHKKEKAAKEYMCFFHTVYIECYRFFFLFVDAKPPWNIPENKILISDIILLLVEYVCITCSCDVAVRQMFLVMFMKILKKIGLDFET